MHPFDVGHISPIRLSAVRCCVSALRISLAVLDVIKCSWHIPQCNATSSLSGSEQESWTRNNGCKMHSGISCEDSMTIKEGHALYARSIGTLQHRILHRQLAALSLHCELLSVQRQRQISTCTHCFTPPPHLVSRLWVEHAAATQRWTTFFWPHLTAGAFPPNRGSHVQNLMSKNSQYLLHFEINCSLLLFNIMSNKQQVDVSWAEISIIKFRLLIVPQNLPISIAPA